MTDPISNERVAVTREDAVAFLECACRNWSHVPKLTEEDIRDVSMELLRFVASRRQSPAGVEIDPLEWKELTTGWIAHTSFHAYEVVKTDQRFMATYANRDFAWGAEDAMKAAAQADYERRVLSCLSTALSSEAHNG